MKAQGSNLLSGGGTRNLVATSEDGRFEMPKNCNCLNYFR